MQCLEEIENIRDGCETARGCCVRAAKKELKS